MIGGRYVKGEQIRINYEAYRLTTGLSDVTISIIKSDGNKEINGASMTELNSSNAPGIYYYDWTPTKPGTMTIYCDSVSKPKTYVDILQVDARGSKYTQVMGVHGGMSKVTINDTWTELEKQKFLDETRKISEAHEKSTEIMASLVNSIKQFDKRIGGIEVNSKMHEEKARTDSHNMFKEIATKVNQLNSKNEEVSARILSSNFTTKKLSENLDKSIKEKIDLIDFKLKRIDEVYNTNIALSEKIVNLKDEIKELHNNISQFGQILIKILPPEKLMEIKNEIQ